VEGCTFGVASGLIYAAEALLFYVGAVLIARGTYMYLQMVDVLNLVVFTVSIGSQLMAFSTFSSFIPHNFVYLLILLYSPTYCKIRAGNKRFQQAAEARYHHRGILRPEFRGPITFNHVGFSYPERADAPVLKDINLQIAEGQCVAIVGPSGAGKSTVTALLQRLYQPHSGSISIGANNIAFMDVTQLRHHISVISQNPNLSILPLHSSGRVTRTER
jgi:ATP-binding cassette subfamily B (MDR/TAP) protein 1